MDGLIIKVDPQDRVHHIYPVSNLNRRTDFRSVKLLNFLQKLSNDWIPTRVYPSLLDTDYHVVELEKSCEKYDLITVRIRAYNGRKIESVSALSTHSDQRTVQNSVKKLDGLDGDEAFTYLSNLGYKPMKEIERTSTKQFILYWMKIH